MLPSTPDWALQVYGLKLLKQSLACVYTADAQTDQSTWVFAVWRRALGPGRPGMEHQLLTQAEALQELHQDRASTRFRNIRETDLSGDGELQSEVESGLVVCR